jgi:uncharacterized membrane protein YphA (DoxX/SURF4 family)
VHVTALVLSLLLALVMLGSGVMKLIRAPSIVAAMAAVHVSRTQLLILGVIEVIGATGLILGMWYPPLALAASIGSVLYFAAAIVAHLRAHDPDKQGAIAFVLLALATVSFLLLSA